MKCPQADVLDKLNDIGKRFFNEKSSFMMAFSDKMFQLLKEVDKTQILTSYIGSVSKMLFHTSIIGIFEFHNVSYTELKSIIMYKNNDITIPGIIWLLSQILVIFLRLLQFYSCTSIFHKKKEKNFWPIIFDNLTLILSSVVEKVLTFPSVE